jgi:hypothetical protein
MVPRGGCLLEMADTGWGGCCPASTLDPAKRVSVLYFLVFCPGPTVFIGCLAGCVGSGFLVDRLTVAGDILALKILDFSSSAWLFCCFVAGDPAGNIFEVINDLR